MSDTAIQVSGLGKAYQIRHEAAGYRTLRDDLVNLLPGRRRTGASRETFWALKDVSFEVKTGEVLGVIGRNGAGKSTLLKILARITKPTAGYADIYGRVGSLLEVGTGFHAELTGRENIFLSGTILGMRRAEIQRRFDEIVAFAEVEQFLDTPVKRYSSGMYMRLAFAVAAHLDPEVLIVDEVLAVGDAAFQKKSLGKMGDVAKSGRTVLFVSHNIQAIRNICHRGLLLDHGEVLVDAPIEETLSRYLDSGISKSLHQVLKSVPRIGGVDARFEEVTISAAGGYGGDPRTGEDLCIETVIRSSASLTGVAVHVVIHDSFGARVIDANSGMVQKFVDLKPDDVVRVSFVLQNLLLRPATYKLELYLGIVHQRDIDHILEAATFEIVPNYNRLLGPFDFPAPYRCEFAVETASVPAAVALG
ncbi:MAG: ABC transporter ATP-binding protein [Anaerolineae bacterium]|nr:ABC transporter ATP-binding protein [Anaerolineae bacterium]